MKITRVWTRALRAKCEPPYACATAIFAERGALLVFVETDAGLTGIGEAYASGGAFASLIATAVEKQLAPLLVGEDATRIEHLWQKLYWRTFRHGRKGVILNAMSGIDIALWDLFGKSCGLPVSRLLGSCHERLPAYASGGFYFEGQDARGLAETCQAYAERGYRAVKIKVGRHASLHPQRASLGDRLSYVARADELRSGGLDEDIERVEAVRAAIGPHVGLAVDANCAWDRTTSLRFCRAVQSSQLLWLEEPVPPDDIAASAEIARDLDVPIAGYETETGLSAWRTLLENSAIDIAQPGISHVGGFTELRRIAAVAEAFRVPVAPHSYQSGVVLAATLHAACSMPNATIVEVDQHQNPLLFDLLEEPPVVARDGTIAPPEGPGLGIKLREDVLDRYTVR